MSQRIFVTGLGVISAIGNNVEENFQSLIHSKSGIDKMVFLNSKHKPYMPVGEVKYSDDDLFKIVSREDKRGITRTTLLAMVAAKEAVEDAQIDVSEMKTGLISATTVGGMIETEKHYLDFFDTSKTGDFLSYIDSHDCGNSTEKVATYLGVRGYANTINTACSSSANAVMLGARLIKAGMLDRVIVGGVDSLTKFTVNGFNSLLILDKTGIKPFSNNRAGLNLGEGAGFLVIEGEKTIGNRKRYSEVTGYSNTCEAYHQTASSPEGDGAFKAMTDALKFANLQPKDISYINAHGTATEVNDVAEGRAIQRLFNKVPPVSSTKAYTGHTLGASGGIEAVYANLAIDRKTIFPNLNFEEQMEELTFTPNLEVIQNAEVNHVLSNAFGFGGNNTSLIFSKIN